MINTVSARRQAQKLISVLDQEYEALRNGRFDRLDTTLRRSDVLVASLEAQQDGDATDLGPAIDQLRAKAARNARLIQASLAGIKAAQKRMDDIRKAVTGLDTYTGRGEKVSLTSQVTTTEKRS